MNTERRKLLVRIFSVFLTAIGINLVVFILFLIYFSTYSKGYLDAKDENYNNFKSSFLSLVNQTTEGEVVYPTNTPLFEQTPAPKKQENTSYSKNNWGGPDLWEAVNNRRKELGVNSLSTSSNLCTIASIRLNELLELGKLDAHEGFANFTERREDLAWIFESYSNISEFLAFGGESAEETVSLWENTLGHKKLLTGGEYVWGCIYAQNTFAVAITAY